MRCTFGIITETWFSTGDKLEKEAEALLLGSGINIFTLNRPAGTAGFSHGGVAVVAREDVTRLKILDFPNPENFEVLTVFGSLAGVKRNIYLVGAYIPPNYTVPRGKDCLKHIADVVLKIKRDCPSALICVGGDFNQWDISDALIDFPDLAEILTPPTRKDRRIDRTFLNWSESVKEIACLSPLEAENVLGQQIAKSDHKIQFLASCLEKREAVVWETYSYRPYSERSASAFIQDMEQQDWSDVYSAVGSNMKASVLQAILDDLMDKHFPEKLVKRKNTDLPWINATALKKIAKKKAVFKAENRSPRWKALRDDLEQYLNKRQQIFLQTQRDKMLGPDASKQFYKNVKEYKAVDRPKSFNIKDLLPGKSDQEAADSVAGYFNQISCEFSPLQPSDIPSTYHRDLPPLLPEQIESKLKKSRKTGSMVKGDIFPKLVNPCAKFLSLPLANIYNCILASYVWPVAWKREYVTTIPKKKMPSSLSDLRNISCTLYISKIFESYVLERALEEVSIKKNQFGGVKGCSTTHMIIEILQKICANAEDYRSATVLTGIDYVKAFNRVSYQHCLAAFKKKSASTPIIRLIATFLTNRTMSVRVGKSWSDPLDVNGGCPQGSILGVFLFNVTTDDLEDDFIAFEHSRLGLNPGMGGRGEAAENVSAAELDVDDDQPEPEMQPAAAVASSPVRASVEPRFPLSPLGGGVFRMAGARRVRININVRNAPPPFTIPPTETKIGTQVLVNVPVIVFKYVDDNIICEKLNFGRVVVAESPDGPVKIRQAISSQNAFIGVTSAAILKGMKVNEAKTTLLCVSDSLNFQTKTFILDSQGKKIDCVNNMKILGFYLSNKTGVAEHVKQTVKKMRQRFWVLYHLRKVGFNEEELTRVYKSNLLPIADYCSAAYHSLLTDLQDQELERAQVGALRHIYGYGLSARKLREKAGVQTLRQRRIELTDKFANKCLASENFSCWFPKKKNRSSARHIDIYEEEFAKCDRFKNSPLFYMRRRLNGKEGKIYGERNREYRE